MLHCSFIRAGIVEPRIVFEYISKRAKFFGYPVDTTRRYLKLVRRSQTCAFCGVVGQYFAVERTHQYDRYQLHMYGINQNGQEVMLTTDHIYPQCSGGSSGWNNIQVLCEICNRQKSNQVVLECSG